MNLALTRLIVFQYQLEVKESDVSSDFILCLLCLRCEIPTSYPPQEIATSKKVIEVYLGE